MLAYLKQDQADALDLMGESAGVASPCSHDQSPSAGNALSDLKAKLWSVPVRFDVQFAKLDMVTRQGSY